MTDLKLSLLPPLIKLSLPLPLFLSVLRKIKSSVTGKLAGGMGVFLVFFFWEDGQEKGVR